MSLKQQIDADIKKAMLAKQKDELRALRSIKSKILLAESEKAGNEVADDAAMKLLMKEAKQRKESMETFQEQGRDDLAEKEQAELEVIERYLPQQLSEEELKAELSKIVEQSGAQGPQDMGKVMGMATKSLAGRADGKMISKVVKELLSQK